MAEIDPYYFGDDGDGDDGLLLDGGGENYSGDNAPHMFHLAESAFASSVFERKVAARKACDAFRQAYFTEQDVGAVLDVVEKLVQDEEQGVRTEIMEQLPPIAVFCHEIGPQLDYVVPQRILPCIVKLMTDKFTQVRKPTQTGLLLLLERGILAPSQVQEHIFPVIMECTAPKSNDDQRTEISAFMSKIAALVGKDVTISAYLERFCALCDDQLFQVRRVCAASMGCFSEVIGGPLTENVLLPKFLELCSDDVWGVRKSCAEVFAEFARSCQMPTKRKFLAPPFVRLLEDSSRWVRISAYQSLGSLIATFMNDESPTPTPKMSVIEEDFLNVMLQKPTQRTQKSWIKVGANREETSKPLRQLTTQNHVQESEVSSPTNGAGDSPMETIINHLFEDGPREVELLDQSFEIEDNSSNEIESNNISEVEAVSSKPDELSSKGQNLEELVCLKSESFVQNSEESEVTQKANNLREDEPEDSTEISRGGGSHYANGVKSGSSEVDPTPSLDAETIESESNSDFPIPISPPEEKTGNARAYENSDHVHDVDSEDSSYNTFQFWRLPLPVIDLEKDKFILSSHPDNLTHSSQNENSEKSDLQSLSVVYDENTSKSEALNGNSTAELDNNQTTVSLVGTNVAEVHRSYMNLFNPSSSDPGNSDGMRPPNPYDDDYYNDIASLIDPDDLPYILKVHGPNGKGRLLQDLPKSITIEQQDIVPPPLLEHFIGMCEPMRDHSMDAELANFCVYNLPAVVLTLGPQNWSLVRDCFETLACKFQWKIRFTLAASLHDIAGILGPELTERDLVPFYDAMTKDLDEVRIGILRNLAKFIKILGKNERSRCLDSLGSFRSTDNKRNWRFRLELSNQVEQLVDIYEAEEVFKHLCPLALDLISDSVAEIRRSAIELITILVSRLRACFTPKGMNDPNLVREFILQLVETLCHSSRWVQRQIFATLSGLLISRDSISPKEFAQDILPHLVGLSVDKVPNVRLVVAQTLTYAASLDYFSDESNPHYEILMATIVKLQNDSDRDVCFFSKLQEPEADNNSTTNSE